MLEKHPSPQHDATHRPLYGYYNVYDGGYFNEEYYMLNRYGKRIKEFRAYEYFDKKKQVNLKLFLEKLKAEGYADAYVYEKHTGYNKKEKRYSIDWVIFLKEDTISINVEHDIVRDLTDVNFRFSGVVAVDSVSTQELELIFLLASDCLIEQEDDHKRYINIVGKSPRGGLTLREHQIRSPKIPDLDLYYGDSFSEKHKKLTELISSEDQSGLFIFHGVTGSGKTNYIRHLIMATDPEIDFIFYPISLLGEIASPDLITFLSEYQNSVLVIEESEDSVQSREKFGANKSSIANLLNVSDGLLSDVLNLKIVCTFNTDIRNLDPALLREGRLLGIHKFTRLPIENANRIAELNQLGRTFKEPATLAEIFNKKLNEDFSDFIVDTNSKIGFSR